MERREGATESLALCFSLALALPLSSLPSGLYPSSLLSSLLPLRTLFEVPIVLPDGTATSLRISLPPGFPAPTAPPSLSLGAPGVRHTWVDAATGRVTCPALARWGAAGSGGGGGGKVAAAVQEVLAGLGAGVVGADGVVVSAAAAPTPAPTTTTPAARMQEEAEFPELAGTDAATLERWVTDEAAFAALAARVAARVGVSATGAAAAAAGADPAAAAEAAALAAAQANLASAAAAAELRNQVAVIRAGEYAVAVEGAAARATRAAAVTAALSPAALVAGLRTAAATADAESARCYDAFLSAAGGGGSATSVSVVDKFTAAYVTLRTKFHERELKQQAAAQTLT